MSAGMVPRLHTMQLALRALEPAELNTGPQLNSQRFELSPQCLEGGRIRLETRRVDIQPILHVFYPSANAVLEVLVQLVNPFAINCAVAMLELVPGASERFKAAGACCCVLRPIRSRKVETRSNGIRQYQRYAVVDVLCIYLCQY